MQIISDPEKDTATPSNNAGGYEWWYFDAIDATTGYAFVIIFYLGNPFSGRYIKQLKKEPQGTESKPVNFPAISISIYKNTEPLYYSFTEFDKDESHFGMETPSIKIGGHSLLSDISEEKLIYKLQLQEKLPSGDQIEAKLTFSSPNLKIQTPDKKSDNDESEGHLWNLVQPAANVRSSIQLSRESAVMHDIKFKGTGYHDHNTGREPMKDEFRDWYWGRFHFPEQTLVYYVMNRKHTRQHRAWLINKKTCAITAEFENVQLRDRSSTIFGLHSARKIILSDGHSQVVIQQSKQLDNGPFYQRFLSDAFLSRGEGEIQKSFGITEYLYPERIYWKLFRPLVDMRIRYKSEEPHWVQKSKRLYRWTW